MNKKTVLSALLCCALLSTATSCNHNNAIHSGNTTDQQLSSEATFEIDKAQTANNNSISEDGSSNKVIFQSYEDILTRYRTLLSNEGNLEDQQNAVKDLDTNDDTIETALQSVVINSRGNQNQMGYSMYDMNGDGQSEFILMDDQHRIYAVFTQINGTPTLLDIFSLNNHYVALDQNGILYKTGYGKGENSYTKVMQITNEGKLESLLEYGYDDTNSEYFIIENNVKRVAEWQDITMLQDRYDTFLQNPSDTTKKSGILFIPATKNLNNTSFQNKSMSIILNDILQQQYTWSEFNAIYPQYEITAQSTIAMNIVVPEFEDVIFVFAGDLNDPVSEYKMASANAGGDILLPEHFGKTFDQILSEEADSASFVPTDEIMQHLYKYEDIYIYREDFYYYIRGYRHTNELISENIAMFLYDENHPRPYSGSANEETLPENIIQSEKHFQIYEYKDTINKHFYRILDSDGNTVISETTTRPLSISMIEDNIIDISISFGSGVCQHQYYDIDKNILSDVFFDVFATSGELIVHMDVSKENAMENRILVIRNIFDKEALFVEYKLDFSNYVIPIEKIEFLTNSNALEITYYKGSEKELTTEILNFS